LPLLGLFIKITFIGLAPKWCGLIHHNNLQLYDCVQKVDGFFTGSLLKQNTVKRFKLDFENKRHDLNILFCINTKWNTVIFYSYNIK